MITTVQAAARTHVGLVRQNNEDACYAGSWLFAVADGMGGHAAGEVASATVIEALRPCDQQAEPEDLTGLLGKAIHRANERLRQQTEADPSLAGMGTTLVAMLWSGSTAVFANVGDSRAYWLRRTGKRDATLVQLTEDHTYGNLVADASDVPHLPERIARFLDGRPDGRSPDLTRRRLQSGDRFLLCSDGLSGFVPRDAIAETLSTFSHSSEAADQLVALALHNGGPDNVTVVVADVIGE